jgi:arginine exporter protein ArgO
MLFVVILLMILERVYQGKARWLLATPPLMILWTNIHGGFLAGLIILAGFAAGEALRAIFAAEPRERSVALQRAKWFGAAGLASAAATLVNPYTYHLHAHIYKFFTEPYHLQNIVEFQSISFHEPAALYLEVVLLLGAVTAGWFIAKHRNFVPLVLIAGWAHLALFSARNIPLFAIIATPFVAQALDEMLRGLERARVAAWVAQVVSGFRKTGAEFAHMDRPWRIHALSVAATGILAILLASPAAIGKLKPEFDPKNYPTQALSVLRASPESRIFTGDQWGDYLIYELYPAHKVFIDGRSDFYGQEFEQKFFDLMSVKYDWQQYLTQYNIDTIVLSPTTPLASAIKESCHWRAVYDDQVAIVFRRAELTEHPRFSTAVSGTNDDPRITRAGQPDFRMAPEKIRKGV